MARLGSVEVLMKMMRFRGWRRCDRILTLWTKSDRFRWSSERHDRDSEDRRNWGFDERETAVVPLRLSRNDGERSRKRRWIRPSNRNLDHRLRWRIAYSHYFQNP